MKRSKKLQRKGKHQKGVEKVSDPNLIISVDPGATKPSTFSVFLDNKFQFVFTVDKFNKDYYKKLDEISKIHTGFLCIETQWYQHNINTLILLVTSRVVIETIFRLNGWEVYRIHPNKWQQFVLKSGNKKRRERKKTSLVNVNEKIGFTKNNDVADSINIGLYAIEKILENKELK